jgi:hypothetical protein
VVPGRVAVVKWLVSQPVSKGVDAERRLLDEEDSKNTSVDEATEPVTPAETSHKAREDQAHEKNYLEVVSVLPDDNGVIVEI